MNAKEQVADERERAIAQGYTAKHDDEHGFLGLIMQAIYYRMSGKKVAAAGLALAAYEAACREMDEANERARNTPPTRAEAAYREGIWGTGS